MGRKLEMCVYEYADIMTETVPVRIDLNLRETLDLLVHLGFYSSRSEAIRELMKKGLESQSDLKIVGRIVKVIEKLDREGKLDLSGLELKREDRF